MSRGLAPILVLSMAAVALLATQPAGAQTPVGNRTTVPMAPPGRTAGAAPGSGPTSSAAPEAPALPVPASVIRQAERQLEGDFPAMERAGVGGQIQDAWNESAPDEGVQSFRLCRDCVYKVRLREFMATTIILPEDAEIKAVDLGDPVGFQLRVKAANMIAVRPASYGMDTNLNVYTKAGAVYPMYLRAESFNSRNVPDVVVKILGWETEPTIESQVAALPASKDGGEAVEGQGTAVEPGKGSAAPEDLAKAAVAGLTSPKADNGDFVRSIPFDPSKLHGWHDYKLWGDDALSPPKDGAVFRDDEFTYIQYGSKWNSVELPTAYVVIDGKDELVNSRVQGSTYIIEAIAPLISLKSGGQYLCVQYTGEKS